MATTNNLFPVFDVPSAIAPADTASDHQYGVAPLFDVETGDVVTDGNGRILMGNGYDAWVLWCTKTILTQRWAHLAYSGAIGVEISEAFQEPDAAAVKSAFERSITEALLADPMGRTVEVRDFVFTWQADSLSATCTVVGTDGNTATVQATIDR